MFRRKYCYYVVWSYGSAKNAAMIVIGKKLNTVDGLSMAERQIKLQYGIPFNHEIVIYYNDCMRLKNAKIKK